MKWGKKFASPQELYHVIQTKHSIFIDNCRGLLWSESFSYKVLSWKQLNNSNTLRNFFNCQRSILTLYLITRCNYCIIKFRLSMIDYEIEIIHRYFHSKTLSNDFRFHKNANDMKFQFPSKQKINFKFHQTISHLPLNGCV